jgi:cytochrome c553
VCAGCHGSKGEGSESTAAPRLAGQYEWYLINQLNNFKTGARGGDERDAKGAIMVSMANTLADDQAVEDVVEYIMTLDPKKYKYKAN